MKKIKLMLFMVLSFVMFIQVADAATANINVSATTPQVIIGNNVTVYVTISSSSPLGAWDFGLNYDSSVFRLVSSSDGLHAVGYVDNNATKSVTFTYTFTAVAKGSSTFSVGAASVIGFDESAMALNAGAATVNTITYNEYQDSLSKNNNLASLGVSGAEISPSFSKDVLEYSVKVSEDTKEINITATVEDGTAKVSGIGPQSVSAGNNTFEIYVVAQNGSEKIYKLNVEVIDKDPIEISYEGKKYTVVKIRDNLSSPKGFKESTTNIDGFEIPTYYSDIMKLTVVGLKDEDGKIVMFTYTDGKYNKYLEINLGNITVRPLELKEELVGYTKSTLRISNTQVECLQKAKEDRYKYIYGVNVETNEEGLFVVDTKDNTLMKYDKEENDEVSDKTKILFYTSCGFAGTTFVSLIIIISLLAKKGKKKSKIVPAEEGLPPLNNAPLKEEKVKKKVCRKCHGEYDKSLKDCPYCALKEEQKPELSDTDKIKTNLTPVVDKSVQTASEVKEDEVYDIFEDDRKRRKKKKKGN